MSADDRSVLPDLPPTPDPANPQSKKRGGWRGNHKPDCACPACAARRRKAEAVLAAVGDDPPTSQEGLINGNLPIKFLRKDTVRARILEWIALKSKNPNMSNIEIAEKLGIAPHTLNCYITKATKEGWLEFEDPMDQIEYEIIPATVRNLKHFLKKKDKQVTIETAKGTIFKEYADVKGLSDGNSNVLSIRIEPVDGQGDIKVVEGQVLGKPREIGD